MNDLQTLRKQIDEIDKEMAILFNKRMKVVEKIKAYKKANNLEIFDKEREDNLIKQNILHIDKEYQDLYKEVETTFLKLSKEYQAK